MRAHALLCLCSASCALPESVWVDLPASAEAESILFALHTPQLRVFAYPVDREDSITLPLVIDESVSEIEAVEFRDSLEVLALGAGEIERGTGSTIGTLANRIAVYTSLRREADFAEWNRSETMSSELAAYPISVLPAENPCSILEADRLELTTEERALFMTPLSNGVVLVGSLDGRLYRIVDSSFTEVDVEPPDVVLTAGADDGFGNLYFASTSSGASTLWTGIMIGSELSLKEAETSSAVFLRLAVARAVPYQVVAIDRRGSWYEYGGGRIERIYRSDNPSAGSKVADLAVVEPGHVIGIHSEFQFLYRYKDGRVTAEGSPGMEEHMRGVELVPGLGPVASTLNESVWNVATEEWAHLGTADIGFPTADMVATSDGFLIGSDLGQVEEFVINHGFCREQLLAGQGEPTVFGAPMNDGAAFVSPYNRDGGPLTVIVVRRRPST